MTRHYPSRLPECVDLDDTGARCFVCKLRVLAWMIDPRQRPYPGGRA